MAEQGVGMEDLIKALSQAPFEEVFTELEETVRRLEEDELSLEEAIALYERGQILARHCQERLDLAELRVARIAPDEGAGEFEREEPLC